MLLQTLCTTYEKIAKKTKIQGIANDSEEEEELDDENAPFVLDFAAANWLSTICVANDSTRVASTASSSSSGADKMSLFDASNKEYLHRLVKSFRELLSSRLRASGLQSTVETSDDENEALLAVFRL